MSDPLQPGHSGKLIPSQRIEGTARTTRTTRARRHTAAMRKAAQAKKKRAAGLSEEQKRLAVMGVVLVLSLLLMVYVLSNRKKGPAQVQDDPGARLASLRMPGIDNFDVDSLQPENLSLEQRNRNERFGPWESDLFYTPPPPPPEVTFHPETGPDSAGMAGTPGDSGAVTAQVPGADPALARALVAAQLGSVVIGTDELPSTALIYRDIGGRWRARLYEEGDELTLPEGDGERSFEIAAIALDQVTLRHGDAEIPLRRASSAGSQPPPPPGPPAPQPPREPGAPAPLPEEQPDDPGIDDPGIDDPGTP